MAKVVDVKKSVMEADEVLAEKVRSFCRDRRIVVVNLIGSPGSGKTTLLEATKKYSDIKFAVIEGDVETARDADRINALGVPVVQINTHGGCHLEANLVNGAIGEMDLEGISLLFVENVGNLVCPAEFDLGEDYKVAVNSVPEGADKPMKYPHLFHKAGAVLLTKTDLLPYISFDIDVFEKDLEKLNPDVPFLKINSMNGDGIKEWVELLEGWVREKSSR